MTNSIPTHYKVRVTNGDFFSSIYEVSGEQKSEDILYGSLTSAIEDAKEFISETIDAADDGHMDDEQDEDELEIIAFIGEEEIKVMTLKEAAREDVIASLSNGALTHWTNPFEDMPDELEQLINNGRFASEDESVSLTTGIYEITSIDSECGKILSQDTKVYLISESGVEMIALAKELELGDDHSHTKRNNASPSLTP